MGIRYGYLVTFVECQTCFDVTIKIENRSVWEIYRATDEWDEFFPKDTYKIYMSDWGREFTCCLKVDDDLNIPVDLTDPYFSW